MTVAGIFTWLVMVFGLVATILWVLIVVPSGIAARAVPQAVPGPLRVLLSFLIMLAVLRAFTALWPYAAILSLFAFWSGTALHMFWLWKSTGALGRTIVSMVLAGALVGVATAPRQPREPGLWRFFKISMRILT